MLVGGYALAFHGFPRNTGDIDIWINRRLDNIALILEALSDFGFSSLNLTGDDFLKTDSVIELGIAPLRIDIITDIYGVSFEEAFTRRAVFTFEGLSINLISREDLIKIKTASGRDIDRADVKKLTRKLSYNFYPVLPAGSFSVTFCL